MNVVIRLIIFSLLINPFCFAETLNGVSDGIVDSITSTISIRTAEKDYVIQFNQLNKDLQTQLLSTEAHNQRQSLDIPDEAIVGSQAVNRADCTELPVTMDELTTIADSSDNMLDFLQKIPAGTLQVFTFVTNSHSLHRGKDDGNGRGVVSRMWPRVLRASADGKMTVSFVCDPINPTYGKVEIIYFDDATSEFKTTEFDFGGANGQKVNPPGDRVHQNPQSCISCHSASNVNGKSSLKPIWPEYFFWSDCNAKRGIQMYGSSDDNMGIGYRKRLRKISDCSEDQDTNNVDKEKWDFQNFKGMQKDNACFNSLPWRNKEFTGRDKDFYPYADFSQINDGGYSVRTNLRFTDTYAHLMAKRMAGIIAKSPEYEKIKYFLIMEDAKCLSDKDKDKIRKLLPGLDMEVPFWDKIFNNSPLYDKESPQMSNPLLYNYTKRIGLDVQDWTMEFNEKKNPDYITGIASEGPNDSRIRDVVVGNILKQIGEENLNLNIEASNMVSRGITSTFGAKFSCIDDLGGAVMYSTQNTTSLCEKLHKENEVHLKALEIAENGCDSCKKTKKEKSFLDFLIGLVAKPNEEKSKKSDEEKFTVEQVARGKKLIEADGKGKCVTCHSAGIGNLPHDLLFIPSDKDSKNAESLALIKARAGELKERIDEYLLKEESMPPIENELTKDDRIDIKAYLQSLTKE